MFRSLFVGKKAIELQNLKFKLKTDMWLLAPLVHTKFVSIACVQFKFQTKQCRVGFLIQHINNHLTKRWLSKFIALVWHVKLSNLSSFSLISTPPLQDGVSTFPFCTPEIPQIRTCQSARMLVNLVELSLLHTNNTNNRRTSRFAAF